MSTTGTSTTTPPTTSTRSALYQAVDELLGCQALNLDDLEDHDRACIRGVEHAVREDRNQADAAKQLLREVHTAIAGTMGFPKELAQRIRKHLDAGDGT